MRRLFLVVGMATALVGSSLPAQAGAQGASPGPPDAAGPSAPGQAVPNQYIVTLRGVTSAGVPGFASAIAQARGGTVLNVYQHALQGFAVRMSPAEALALSHDPNVASVEPDGIVHATGTQVPAPSWGLDRIDERDLPLDSTYVYGATASNVHAYIIDTGIRVLHQDFGGRASVGKVGTVYADFVGDGQNGNDCNGHGTHVAGTVGGSTYGVAKSVQLVSVRVLDCNGSGYFSWVIKGIDWVTANAVKPAVANMSLGGGAYDDVDAAVTNSIASGVTYAIAAGNNADDACSYSPARTPNALTVGATTNTDARASFSNYGSCVDLFGPGVNIKSDSNGSDSATATLSGTSMATPHVTGTAALYLSQHPTDTPGQVEAAIESNATTGHVLGASGSPNLLDYSGFITAGPATAPAAPTLTVSDPGAGLHLSWTVPSDGGSPLTGFSVYRGTTSGGEDDTPLATLGANATSYDDTAVSDGTTYFYEVGAVNAIGETRSTEKSGVPRSLPGVPTDVTAAPTSTSGRVLVGYSAPASDGGSPITSYQASCAASGQTTRSATDAAAPFDPIAVSSLTTGVTYACSVRAYNVLGAGPSSAAVSVYVPKPPTVAPAGLKAAPTGASREAVVSSSEIATTVTATGGSPVTGYKATCTASGYPTGLATDTAAPFEPITVTGMTDGVIYTCKTQALNIVGAGPTQTTGATVKVGAPPAPAGVSTTPDPPTPKRVAVGYTPSGLAGITKYEATCTAAGYPTGTASDAAEAFDPIPVTGLTQGITYACKVRAYNAVGAGPWSPAVSIYVPKKPTVAPGGLKAAPTGVGGEAVVSSTQIASTLTATGGSPVTGYEASCAATGQTTRLAQDMVTPFEAITVTGMQDGVTYTCKTRAVNAYGPGPWQTTGATVRVGAPTAPANVANVPGANAKEITVSWDASSSPVALSSYIVTCTSGTSTKTVTVGDVLTTPVGGLTSSLSYRCKVAGKNASGTGPATQALTTTKPK